MSAGRTRYGLNDDGSLSPCCAKPENVGKYRCHHAKHFDMTSREVMEFTERMTAARMKSNGNKHLLCKKNNRGGDNSSTKFTVRNSNDNNERVPSTPVPRSPREINADIESLNAILDSSQDNMSADMDEVRNRLCAVSMERDAGAMNQKLDTNSMYDDVKNPDGGGTWNPIRGVKTVRGFCYSKYPERSEIIEIGTREQFSDQISDFYDRNKDLISKPEHYIGLWHDPADDKVYLDVSERTFDAREARQACADNDQISYFDLQRFESVTVNQDAKSGQED